MKEWFAAGCGLPTSALEEATHGPDEGLRGVGMDPVSGPLDDLDHGLGKEPLDFRMMVRLDVRGPAADQEQRRLGEQRPEGDIWEAENHVEILFDRGQVDRPNEAGWARGDVERQEPADSWVGDGVGERLFDVKPARKCIEWHRPHGSDELDGRGYGGCWRDIDDDEPLDELRVLECEEHRHLASHAVAKHRCGANGSFRNHPGDIGGHCRVVVTIIPRALAVVSQIDRDDVMIRGKPVGNRRPVPLRSKEPVQNDKRLALTGLTDGELDSHGSSQINVEALKALDGSCLGLVDLDERLAGSGLEGLRSRIFPEILALWPAPQHRDL